MTTSRAAKIEEVLLQTNSHFPNGWKFANYHHHLICLHKTTLASQRQLWHNIHHLYLNHIDRLWTETVLYFPTTAWMCDIAMATTPLTNKSCVHKDLSSPREQRAPPTFNINTNGVITEERNSMNVSISSVCDVVWEVAVLTSVAMLCCVSNTCQSICWHVSLQLEWWESASFVTAYKHSDTGG